MSLENGSPSFRIDSRPKFDRSFKALKKGFKSKRQEQQFVAAVTALVEALAEQPRPPESRLEPMPKGVAIPAGGEFRKLVFAVPGTAGAAGEGRLMYFVHEADGVIQLFWIYTHEEFKGRPPEKELKQILREALESAQGEE
jgi:hypothetical protein